MAQDFEPVTLYKGDRTRVVASQVALVKANFEGYYPRPEEAAVVAETTSVTPYDPFVHSAAEVNAYLATADAAEAERVVGAERAGKNRTSITG